MTEAIKAPYARKPREAHFTERWHVAVPAETELLKNTAAELGVTLMDGKVMRGGGILTSAEASTPFNEKPHAPCPGEKAVVLGKTRGSSEPNVIIHFPTSHEGRRYDATFYSYQADMGNFLKSRWNTERLGMNPLPGIIGSRELPDGRHVTAVRFRRNFEPLGAENRAVGIHKMNTSRIHPNELRHLVRVLNAMHVSASDFQQWARNTNVAFPKESWLNPQNNGYAFRGKEWWISPTGKDDRIHELSEIAKQMKAVFSNVDVTYDVAKGITSLIKNNIDLYPHQNGTVDNPRLAADAVVAHGTLYPDNIHIKHDPDGKIHFTVSGGDRAQGYGTRGQMIDWLVTSAAGSPPHQRAMIDEYLRLNPGDKDKRSLAMQLTYRSIMEIPWFVRHGKSTEANNLATLTLDILKGNGPWAGVNTPLTR